jgi:hypothetical protein
MGHWMTGHWIRLQGWIAGLMALALVGAIALGMPAVAQAQGTAITVYRSPTCQCCGHWVDRLQAAGFQVQNQVTEDMAAIKAQYGVPSDLASCHTAIAEGYVIEGHVPAADVQRLLRDRPPVVGIAAPGMPLGSPGMEVGDRIDPYTVFAFTEDGDPTVFAHHP